VSCFSTTSELVDIAGVLRACLSMRVGNSNCHACADSQNAGPSKTPREVDWDVDCLVVRMTALSRLSRRSEGIFLVDPSRGLQNATPQQCILPFRLGILRTCYAFRSQPNPVEVWLGSVVVVNVRGVSISAAPRERGHLQSTGNIAIRPQCHHCRLLL
jgi:hypothetical protein